MCGDQALLVLNVDPLFQEQPIDLHVGKTAGERQGSASVVLSPPYTGPVVQERARNLHSRACPCPLP